MRMMVFLMGWLASAAGAAAQMAASAPAAPADEPLVTTTSADSAEYLVLRIDALLRVDPTIVDPAEARRKLVADLRQVPPLVAQLDERHPQSRYRPLAKSLLIDALNALRNAGDAAGSDDALAAAANDLLALADEPALTAKARYTLLSVDLTAALRAASQPADRATALGPFIDRYVALAGEFPRTPHAPVALHAAASVALEAGREPRAVELLDRLAADYPRDAASYDALLLLVQLHRRADRADAAAEAQRRLVEAFPGSDAALAYRAELAQTASVGRPFHLRFRAIDGERFDIRDHRGKPVLVYLFLSARTPEAAQQVARELAAVREAAGEEAVLVAIGADDAFDAETVRAHLAAEGVTVPVLLDAERQVAAQYGVLVAPSLAVVDAEGRLVAIVPGPDVAATLRRMGE